MNCTKRKQSLICSTTMSQFLQCFRLFDHQFYAVFYRRKMAQKKHSEKGTWKHRNWMENLRIENLNKSRFRCTWSWQFHGKKHKRNYYLKIIFQSWETIKKNRKVKKARNFYGCRRCREENKSVIFENYFPFIFNELV